MKQISGRLIPLIAGVLLVLLGVRTFAVKVAGHPGSAVVTKVERVVNEQSKGTDHNYRIDYEFSVNGSRYTGSLTRNKVFNAATLPSVGQALAIRYVSAAPWLNEAASASWLGGAALGALGVILLVVGLRSRGGPAPVAKETPPAPKP